MNTEITEPNHDYVNNEVQGRVAVKSHRALKVELSALSSLP